MSLPDRLLVAAVLISALWWACSRHRRPSALQRLSAVAPVLAAATLIFDGGPRWQLVPWQGLAVGVALAAAPRRRRPGPAPRSVRRGGAGARHAAQCGSPAAVPWQPAWSSAPWHWRAPWCPACPSPRVPIASPAI